MTVNRIRRSTAQRVAGEVANAAENRGPMTGVGNFCHVLFGASHQDDHIFRGVVAGDLDVVAV
ncbi:hypothetical protein D3C71_1712200 [compost metagenome]